MCHSRGEPRAIAFSYPAGGYETGRGPGRETGFGTPLSAVAPLIESSPSTQALARGRLDTRAPRNERRRSGWRQGTEGSAARSTRRVRGAADQSRGRREVHTQRCTFAIHFEQTKTLEHVLLRRANEVQRRRGHEALRAYTSAQGAEIKGRPSRLEAHHEAAEVLQLAGLRLLRFALARRARGTTNRVRTVSEVAFSWVIPLACVRRYCHVHD